MHKILEILSDNLYKKDVFFVFPTEIAASTWLEKLVTVSVDQNTKMVAVAKERFLSWDTFKSESIKSRMQNKRSIPSIMRKLFAENLIEQNKTLIQNQKQPLFKEIINPQYADLSSSFADWIASLLPQLKSWKTLHDSHNQQIESANSTNEEISPVEQDYQTIYENYTAFLTKYNLFEPAWETPPFNNDGKHFVIFFPESLQDFNDYQELLLSSEHITIKTTKDLCEQNSDKNSLSKAIQYNNSPEELHNIALTIKDLAENKQIPYTEIAVSLTDVDKYLPYIEKEFQKYAIPYNTRIGKPLSNYESGKLFSQLQKCYSENFSFEVLRNLLTNAGLPWKEPNLAKLLIQFGIANNCVCAFIKDGTTCFPFEEAFSSSFCDQEVKKFYYSLKSIITKMNTAKTFDQIIKLYWEFKEFFFYEYESETQTETQKEMDLILGRAVSELVSLQKLQTEFPEVPVFAPFAFFVKIVENKEYLQQSQNLGVCIYPYQVVAASPFSVHIIPNASQKQLTVKYYKLRFLPQTLKEQFNITETDVSETFLKMYQCSSFNQTLLTIANNSYSGYSIPHALLQTTNYNPADKKNAEITKQFDIIQNEKRFIHDFDDRDAENLLFITKTQQKGMNAWATNAIKAQNESSFPNTAYRIESKLLQNNSLRVSATLLKQYATCKKKVVFQRLLNLFEEQTESVIDDDKKLGTFYHKVLEEYFKYHNKNGLTISLFQDNPQNFDLLKNCISNTFETFSLNPINKMLFFARLNGIEETLINFLTKFTATFAGFTVSFVEKELSATPENVKIFFYQGIIDLVLTNEEQTYIVDYKTRYTPSLTDCYPNDNNELADFQMAMYCYLLSQYFLAKKDNKFTITNMAFASITDGSIKEMYPSTKKYTEQGLQTAINTMHIYATELSTFLTTTPLDLTVPQNKKECSSCKYQTICRTNYNVSKD